MSFSSPAATVGRHTALILASVVGACLFLIAGTGYLKYKLDRAETMLAAPDTAVGSDQEVFNRLRRDLGYGGFLGLAQNYALNHDASGFAEMKAEIKSADDIVAHLPDKTPPEARHDLSVIVATFDAALKKISAAPTDTNEFTANDLTPLYAALPILDDRVSAANAATRLEAQGKVQFWGMMLTLVSWCSLIAAAACAAGIYLAVRDKHSAPMRALSQSIQNMARGDMRTAIWGTERQDQIGELARAVDIARYHFSHLPDLSLLSDQGPVRMRFEGGTRSLFEAMMKAISRDSENIRDQTLGLNEAVKQQRESISLMSEKVETVLQNILQNGQSGDKQIRTAIAEMASSAENLKNAHAHAADQLNRLIPQIQERVQGMAEIAHITGRQVSTTLQALNASEAGLKANAIKAEETLSRLSSTADGLGERLFGAINLLQASGKVLAETTESMQAQINLVQPDSATAAKASVIEPLAQRLEKITGQLVQMQTNMNDQITAQSLATEAQIGLLTTHSNSLLTQTATTVQTISAAADHLRDGQQTFEMALSQIEGKLEQLAQNVARQAVQAATAGNTNNLARDQFAAISDKLTALQTHIDHTANMVRLTQEEVVKSKAPAGLDTALAHLETKLENLAISLSRQASLAASSSGTNNEIQLKITAIEQFMEQQKKDIIETSGALSHETHDRIAGLTDKITALQSRIDETARMAETTRQEIVKLSSPAPTPIFIPKELQEQMDGHWYQMAAQIEASRSSLEQAIHDQLTGKLESLEKVLSSAQKMAEATNAQVKAQPQVASLPPELKQQMQDYWDQIAAQIESSRASLAQMVAEQIGRVELRLASTIPQKPGKDYADPVVQRQIEQQTQILSELVATMSMLDTHMQQLKSDIDANRGAA